MSEAKVGIELSHEDTISVITIIRHQEDMIRKLAKKYPHQEKYKNMERKLSVLKMKIVKQLS